MSLGVWTKQQQLVLNGIDGTMVLIMDTGNGTEEEELKMS
jgi:hypothetical protein